MNIGEILIWESTNGLLLIPVVIGLDERLGKAEIFGR
jgi:hypothetical protein